MSKVSNVIGSWTKEQTLAVFVDCLSNLSDDDIIAALLANLSSDTLAELAAQIESKGKP